MENQKKNNKTYLLITLGVLAAIVITLGITYAYWRLTKEQTNENVVTTACLDVDIESQEDDINLPKAYPISDSDAESLVPFKFTVHNKCEDNASYQINLESMSKKDGEDILEDERLNPKYLKYKINEVGTSGNVGLLTGEKNNDTSRVDPTITDAYDAHILTTGLLKGGASKSYEFRLWMDSETTAEEIDSMNKTFVSKISVTSTYAIETFTTLKDTILGLEIQGEDTGATGLYKVEHTGANIEYTTEADKVQNLQKVEYRFAGKDPNNYISFEETEPNDIYELYFCLGDLCFWGSEGFGLQTFDTIEECEETNNQLIQEAEIPELQYGNCKLKVKAGDKIYWRVIGLVNTPEGQKLKIIRDSIGSYTWDLSDEGVNRGLGVNEWSKSDLMKLLNPNFDGEDANNSLFWNGTSGNCVWNPNTPIACDFTGIGMPEELKVMIEEVTWNTGANADDADVDDGWNPYYEIPTTKMYEYERSQNNGKQLCESQGGGDECNDEEVRTYTWRGKVGLMYPSDYGYATSGGSNDNRSKCLNQNLFFWEDYSNDGFYEEPDHPDCYENDWLLTTNWNWTITPASYTDTASFVFHIDNGGKVAATYSNSMYGVRPSVYLKSNVVVLNGEGTKESPWILGVKKS